MPWRQSGNSNAAAAPAVITPPASTVAWQNTTGFPMLLVISGGTVTVISVSRDNAAYFILGLIAGSVLLAPNDYIKLTYAVAPTVFTGFPQ